VLLTESESEMISEDGMSLDPVLATISGRSNRRFQRVGRVVRRSTILCLSLEKEK